MNDPRGYRCDHCGEPIGAYEPIFTEQHDGTLRSIPPLELDATTTARVWHARCYAHARLR